MGFNPLVATNNNAEVNINPIEELEKLINQLQEDEEKYAEELAEKQEMFNDTIKVNTITGAMAKKGRSVQVEVKSDGKQLRKTVKLTAQSAKKAIALQKDIAALSSKLCEIKAQLSAAEAGLTEVVAIEDKAPGGKKAV